MDQPDVVLVLTTWPVTSSAVPVATALVEEGLAACVNVLPEMTSVFRWQGAVQRDREHQLVVKTTAGRVPALTDRLRSFHPYELPELLVVPVTGGGEAYLAWLAASTTPQS